MIGLGWLGFAQFRYKVYASATPLVGFQQSWCITHKFTAAHPHPTSLVLHSVAFPHCPLRSTPVLAAEKCFKRVQVQRPEAPYCFFHSVAGAICFLSSRSDFPSPCGLR